MALVSKWTSFLREAGVADASIAAYAKSLTDNDLLTESAGQLDRDILTEVGITSIGHALAILKHAKKETESESNATACFTKKPPTTKAPTLVADRTRPQFRKFKIDWGGLSGHNEYSQTSNTRNFTQPM